MKSLFFATSVHMFLSARLLIYKNINTVPKRQVKMVKVLNLLQGIVSITKPQCTESYSQLHLPV